MSGIMSDEIRRNMALFPIGIVMKLTDLTARQIRYYEQHELIRPVRTSGNQRLFSFNDVERLLKIKELIEKGINIAGIKEMMSPADYPVETTSLNEEKLDKKAKDMSDEQIHTILKRQLMERKPGQVSLIQGELARFYNNKKS
jgi:MerR family glutamine synthetase transcriptional repressor